MKLERELVVRDKVKRDLEKKRRLDDSGTFEMETVYLLQKKCGMK